MELVHVDLSPELDHVSETDILLCVADEESLRHERCVLIENLRLQQAVEICFVVVSAFVVAGFEVVRIGVVDVLSILIEDLELQEVDALLEEIDVAEMFEMENEFGSCSV